MRQPASNRPQTRSKLPTEARLLEPQGVAFVAEHRFIFLALPWLYFRILDLYFISPSQDTHRYFSVASQWFAGQTPYVGNFLLEYPPGSLFAFILPRLFTDNFNRYCWLFAAEMLVVDLAMLWLVMRVARLLHASLAQAQQSETVQRYDGLVAGLAYVVFTGLLGYLAFERYDLVFALLALAWVESTLSRRHRLVADGMLALGIWFKLLSAMFVPIYLAYLCAQDLGPMPQGAYRAYAQRSARWMLRAGAMRLVTITGLVLALFLPFYLKAPTDFFFFLKYHHDRGIQIESSYASILLFLHHLVDLPLRTHYAYGATELVHPVVKTLTQMSMYIGLGTLAAASAWFGRKILLADTARTRAHLLVEAAAVHLLLFMACGKVFSPQYLLWLTPFAGLVVLRDPPKMRRWLLGFAGIFSISALILFFYYVNVIWLEAFPTALLVARNALVLGLALSIAELPSPAPITGYVRLSMGRLGAFFTRPLWGTAAFLMCAVWVFCANLSETTANDIWIQLKSGEDIVKSHAMPYVETYSATVMGHAFIAHEWLSGVLFYALDWAFGDAGLSFLAAFVALGTFLLMYFAFDKAERKTLWYLPLLLFLSYLVAFRVLVRPHIFTIIAQAGLMMAIERWRRKGGIAQLLWLVPMQLLWINLHGAALFGPAFIAMVAGCVALQVMLPALQEYGGESRSFEKRDVVQLACIAAAMGLACIVNPYGTGIVKFSLELFQNSYAKTRVWEWTTPFLPTNVTYYWLWLYISGLVLLWVSVITRLRFVPIIDLAYAVLVTYLSTRANRFVPDFAIFSFPIMVRAFAHLAKTGLRPAWRLQQPWLEFGMASLLFTNCVVYGYAHSAREHRPLIGWGYGGDMPYQECDLIKRLGLQGVIYNEYSDGALIINRLVPKVRPVLDSRIDLYPLDFVEEYDTAYMYPGAFERFLNRYNVNIVMLYKQRSSPRVVQWIEHNPAWRTLSTTNGRLLYVKRNDLVASNPP